MIMRMTSAHPDKIQSDHDDPEGGGDDGRGVDMDTVRALLVLAVVAVTPPSSSCSPAPFSVSLVPS